MHSREIAWESYEESETIYSVIIIINKAGIYEVTLTLEPYIDPVKWQWLWIKLKK